MDTENQDQILDKAVRISHVLKLLGKICIQLFFFQLWVRSWADWVIRKGKRNPNTFSIWASILLRILSLCLSLYSLPLSPSSSQLQPRLHNIDNFLRYHIIVSIFPWNKLCQNPFHPKPSHFFFLINSLKSISSFKTKKIFNETWCNWLSISPSFPASTIPPLPSYHFSSHALK